VLVAGGRQQMKTPQSFERGVLFGGKESPKQLSERYIYQGFLNFLIKVTP
jgi:hypothetical protein